MRESRLRPIRLVLLTLGIGVNVTQGCGHLELGLPEAAGQAGTAGVAAGGSNAMTLAGAAGELPDSNAGAAGEVSNVGAAGEGNGLTCAAPDGVWQGCRNGQPCSVCASRIASFPLYLANHPGCDSWYACDHGPQSNCSSNCPPPGGADQCDGTPGNWKGCRGLGCYVCAELVLDYPKYFENHPHCISNDTCGGLYATCSAACPTPGPLDQ